MSLWRTKKPKRLSFGLKIINRLYRRSNCRQWCHKLTDHSRCGPYFYLTDHQLSHLVMMLQNRSRLLLWVRMQSFHLQDQLLDVYKRQLMDIQKLTKKNQEFIHIATNQLIKDGKSDQEIKDILGDIIPEPVSYTHLDVYKRQL